MTNIAEASAIETDEKATNQGKTGILAAGGIVGVLVASSCCVLPLTLTLFGGQRRLDVKSSSNGALSVLFHRGNNHCDQLWVLPRVLGAAPSLRRRCCLRSTTYKSSRQNRTVDWDGAGAEPQPRKQPYIKYCVHYCFGCHFWIRLLAKSAINTTPSSATATAMAYLN